MLVLRGTGGLFFSIIKETLTMACHYFWIRGEKKRFLQLLLLKAFQVSSEFAGMHKPGLHATCGTRY